jgi:alkylation response protein AidB-like acyl-CoA dehydrogenase
MNLDETAEEQQLRAEIRSYVAGIPGDVLSGRTFQDKIAVDKMLAGGGYLGFHWPTEFGGQSGTPTMAAVIDEELALGGITSSSSPSRFGINLLGPTLMEHGTRPQIERFLPPILRVEEIWCQGFSEPDAGSDLAGVRCALVDGDPPRVYGSKLWTSQANQADWCFALVRTEGNSRRHGNLNFVLIDMKQPGIQVRPIQQITGNSHFNELHFDGVIVQPDHIVGGRNNGWRVAMTTLAAERTYGQLSRFSQYRTELEKLDRLLERHGALQADEWAARLEQVRADVMSIRHLSLLLVSKASAGEDVGVLPSIIKLCWSTTHQRIAEIGLEIATVFGDELDFWFPLWLESRAETIYAGSSQIQLNIIAQRGLRLPRHGHGRAEALSTATKKE